MKKLETQQTTSDNGKNTEKQTRTLHTSKISSYNSTNLPSCTTCILLNRARYIIESRDPRLINASARRFLIK